MASTAEPLGVLVFSKTNGFRHDSIPAGIAAFERLAQQSQSQSQSSSSQTHSLRPFTVTATEDPTIFTPSSLSKFGVIVLLQCSGDFMDETQLEALKGFVRAGSGIVGVHCALTGMPSYPWYGEMLGAVFTDHPVPQRGVVTVHDPEHPVMRGTVGKGKGAWSGVEAGGEGKGKGDGKGEVKWECFDEWYNYERNPREVPGGKGMEVLYSVDEGTYEGGKHGSDHPIAWCREFEGARVFYTALGHFDEAYEDEAFLGQLVNAIGWTSRQI